MDWTDAMIYNCFVSKNYKQLQQRHSLIFLMVEVPSPPKKFKKFKILEGSSLKLVK